MNLKYFNSKNKYYKQILFTIVISIVIIICILSFVLYFNFENIVLSQTNIFIKDNLSKVSYSSTFMSESANMLLMQLFKDNLVQNLLYNISTDPLSLYLSINRVRSYRNSTPYVQSIYIYNGKSGKIYYDTTNSDSNQYESLDFFDKEIFNIIKDKKKGIPNTPIPRVIRANTSFNLNYNVYTYILYELPIKHSKDDNFIVLNISEDWINKLINSLDSNQQGEIFIINGKGKMVSSIKSTPLLTDISHQSYIQKILKSKTTSGYFLDNVKGIKSLVTYVSSVDNIIDWKYIHITPYSIITKRTDELKVNTILISGFIILLGLVISLYTSSKLYKPIDIILENLKKLKGESRKSLNIIKQDFLRNLIKIGSQQNVKMDDIDIELDLSGSFMVIVLMIDHYSDFCSKYGYSDRNLFKFAIMNLTGELCSNYFKNECIDMDNDDIVMLLNPDETSGLEFEKTLEELVENIQAAVNKNLGISLSVVINSLTGSLETINLLYKQAIDASDIRIFYGHGCIIYSNRILIKDSSEYVYPVQKEKSLTNSLMLRNIDEVKTIFNEILKSTEEYSCVVLNLVMLRLTLAINSTIDNIKKGKDISISYSFNEFISKLNKVETIDEINNHFCGMFEYIIYGLEGIKTTNHNYLVNKVARNIDSNYKDQNLGIEALAATLGMSGDYLGRVFRTVKSKSIAEYINEVRIKKAEELLEKTNKSINDITNEIGFQNHNYFYIVFKKLNGITPAEYRQRIRKEDVSL